MCEKPKEEDRTTEKPGKDQPRSYYYDDAHGYEDFDPETTSCDEEEDDEDESA